MKKRNKQKQRRMKKLLPAILLSSVLFLNMSVFYIDSSTSHATSETVSDDSSEETGSMDDSTDEDATTEYLVTTEYPDEPEKAPDLVSNYAIVLDANTGNILYQKNAFDKQYPASITKIMTFLLALENTKLTDTVTMSHDAVFGIDRGSSHIGLDEGEQISMEDALYGMMLESANEVAWGIGELISGGSIDDFADMMNERAKALGCQNTHFVNANGLPDENHYTTCYDMALMTQACLAYDDFRTICGTRNHVIGPTNICEEERQLWQHCKLTNPDSKYYYEYCEGGKTGYTNDALNTLVSWSKKGDTELICVLMNCNGASNTYTDSIALYNYCFSNYSILKPLENYTFDDAQTGAVLDYLNQYYNVTSGSDISLQVDNDYELNFNNYEDSSKLSYTIEYNEEPEHIDGQYAVGYLVLSYEGNMIGRTRLTVSGYDAAATTQEDKKADKKEDTITVSAGVEKRFHSQPGFIILIALLVLAVVFVLYLFYVQNARKKQRAMQATRKRQYEERKRQLMDTFDIDLSK